MIMPVSQELLREESNFKQKIPRIEVKELDKLIKSNKLNDGKKAQVKFFLGQELE